MEFPGYQPAVNPWICLTEKILDYFRILIYFNNIIPSPEVSHGEGQSAKIDSFNVKSLALFGSAARDESHALSDIDMLVEFKDKATFDPYMKLKFFLENTLGCPVDLVTRKALKQRLRDSDRGDAATERS